LCQLCKITKQKNGKISLSKHNETDDVIDVYSGDIQVERGKLHDLILDPNIVIIRLRPGKSLHIDNLHVITGTSKDNAAMFSLLDNVKYKPADDDVEPFNSFTGQGVRSIEYDPKKFELSFTTTGNISPNDVINKCADVLHGKFERARAKISEYVKHISEFNDKTTQYSAFGLDVNYVEDIAIYKFIGEYITFAYLLAHQCYRIDPNVEFCSPTIDRYDNEIAIIKLKHADSNKLLLSAIDNVLSDIQTFRESFRESFKKV
jgi:DNA-directed RNA polymerase subunit L